MSLLQNTDWMGAEINKRIIAKSIVRCELGDVREIAAKEGDGNGESKGPKSKLLVNLTLAQAAKTTDGEEVAAGFPTVISINEWGEPDQDARAAAKVKELAVAVLGLDRKVKPDAFKEAFNNSGGWAALKGRPLMVEFDVRRGYQEVTAFNRIPATT